MHLHFSAFHNATIEVTRSQGSRGPGGYTETDTQVVLQGRCDAQESGRALQRRIAAYEKGDVLAYYESSVTSAEVGDDVSLSLDDGRTLNGTVAKVEPLNDALLVELR